MHRGANETRDGHPEPRARLRVTAGDLRELDEIAAAADDEGLSAEEMYQPQAVEPVTAIILLGAAGGLAKVVLDYLEKRRGGTIIDLRDNAEKHLYRTPDVQWGWLVVISVDGKVTVDVKDAPKDALERWISTLIQHGVGTAKAVADAAKSALGQERVRSESPA